MKTIYSLLFTLSISVTAFAQSSINIVNDNANGLTPTQRKIPSKSFLKTSAAGMSGRFDPGYALITTNGVLPSEIAGGSAGTKVGLFVSPTYCDSTTRSSFATASYISNHKFGMNFDPKSIIFDQVNFNPLLTASESYYLDTVWVGNFYQRRTTFNDTLLVEVVWGDTTNTTVFGTFSFAAPNGFFGTYFSPLFNPAPGVQGSASFLTAPPSNKLSIKYVLTDADTATTNLTGYIPVVVNGLMGQLIPADNIVSAVATFIPGQPNIPVGTVCYSSATSTNVATVNGMAARIMVQNAPSPPTAGSAYFDDLSVGKNYTTYSFKRERYNMPGTFGTKLRSSPSRAYMIDFSIHTPVVTNVKDLQNNGFGLTQNSPNPYTKESMVKYSLPTNVNSVLFTVTDIMGRVVSSEKTGTTTGSHSVKLGAYAAGVYYYSLNVDGNVTTKKMIVE